MNLRPTKNLLLAAFLLAAPSVQAAPLPYPKLSELLYPTQIRVRLAEASAKVDVSGTGLRLFESPRSVLAGTEEGVSRFELRCQSGRVRAVPLDGGPTRELREPVIVRASDAVVNFEGRPYREELEIHSVGSLCEVVNRVDLERYLGGLVNSEFNSRWNDEAVGAQVVAARTYALFQIMAARGEADRHYDVDATVRDQVYDGSMREDPRASSLVERTRGWVLTVGDSGHPRPLKAFYHSTCGGMTELPEHVWGNSFEGFRHPVRCPFCASSPALNWQLDVTAAEVAQAFERAQAAGDAASAIQGIGAARGRWPAFEARRLVGIRAGSVDEEGRVLDVITAWRVGRQKLEWRVGAAHFREWIGAGRLKSTAFQVAARADGWHFQGRGNGHGVGMCQWGAKTMGERGYKTAAILKYYYPDAILRKLW